MTLVGLLVLCIVVCVALYCARLLITDGNTQRIVSALIAIAALMWLLEGFGLFGAYSHPIRVFH